MRWDGRARRVLLPGRFGHQRVPSWLVVLLSAACATILITAGLAADAIEADAAWLAALAAVVAAGVAAAVAWTVELEQRRRSGARLARLGLAVANGMEGAEALQDVLEAVRALLSAEVVVLVDVTGVMETRARVPLVPAAGPPAEALARMAARSREPVVVAPCPPEEVERAWGGRSAQEHIRSVAWLPVMSGDAVLGVIGVASARSRGLSQGQAGVFAAVGELVGACLRSRNLLARLEERASLDGLTGVLNRAAVDRALDTMIAAASRAQQPLCVAMFDLDHFKAYNDLHGHLAGDRVLKAVAATLQAGVRRNDMVGRFGGEEFLIVFDGVGLVDAMAALARIRVSLPSGVTASVGLAQWRAGEHRERLVRRADDALYRAKRDGRDRVTLAE